jgi:hypothetical protein
VCVIGGEGYGGAFEELTLTELLNDPLIRLLMGSDGVDVRRLRQLLVQIALIQPFSNIHEGARSKSAE